jgi:opacity protein-like surface antigen
MEMTMAMAMEAAAAAAGRGARRVVGSSAALAACALMAAAGPAWATAAAPESTSEPPAGRFGEGLRISYAPKAFHVTSDPDFVDWNHIVAFEWVTARYRFWGADRSHLGLSLFDNSYGQFSQSIYAGLEWNWMRVAGGELFVALSLGLVNGYDDPWADKVPLNEQLGVGVTLVPALGWQRDAFGLALSLSGSAFVLRASYTFGP